MFIYIAYKDSPELSSRINTRSRSAMDVPDTAAEKTLLVNPNCPVRIMLEYIRKKCRLGVFTQFDLCDESGQLKGLFNMATFAYATEQFEHKKTYYVIVFKMESDRRYSVLPQVNRDNKLYAELKARVKKYLMSGEISPVVMSTPRKSIATPPAPAAKVSSATAKTPLKKK